MQNAENGAMTGWLHAANIEFHKIFHNGTEKPS